MPSDEANSAWHPAFMPNASIDVVPKALISASDLKTASRQPEGTKPPVQESNLPTEATEQPLAGEEATPANDWFSEQEVGDSWLEQAGEIPATNGDHSQESDLPLESPEEEGADVSDVASDTTPDAVASARTPDTSSPTASKHLSTASFTRTVSHEVNWDADDDDAEWSLPRTDTDPFKFMAPNHRTNSFPAISPMREPPPPKLERPLPTSQTDELMSELDRESSPIKSAPGPSDQFASHDILALEHEASDARYEEGIPLISQAAASSANVGEVSKDILDPFADETAGDDDFDLLIGSSGGNAAVDPSRHEPLERKSTMQVLSSLTANPPERADTGLEHTVEESPEEDDFWNKPEPAMEPLDATSQAEAPEEDKSLPGDSAEPVQKEDGDLAAQWAAAFGEDADDELLLEDSAPESKGVDPASFFGDDDEGFLEDTGHVEEEVKQDVPTTTPAPSVQSPGLNGRYTPTAPASGPASVALSRQGSSQNQYLPSPAPIASTQAASAQVVTAPFIPPVPITMGYGAPPPRPELNKATSFADKSKGGYTSPYDLPVEIKPRKRPSTQHLVRPVASSPVPGPPHAQPPRHNAASAQGSTLARAASTPMSPPVSSHPPVQVAQHSSASVKPPPQRAQSGEGFFAELPLTSRPRPGSRSSQKSVPSPQGSPSGPPHGFTQGPPPHATPHGPPSVSHHAYGQPPAAALPSLAQQPGISGAAPATVGLVAPERVSPYAQLQSSTMPPPSLPSATSNRYSPAPSQLSSHASAPPTVSNRYSPAPPASRAPSSGYAAVTAGVTPSILPHQPRTSSPLAHFEISHDRSRASSSNHVDNPHPDRRSSSAMFEPRLNRMPSLPPTREVEEETAPEGPLHAGTSTFSPTYAPSSLGQVHTQVPHQPRQTPPPAPLPLTQSTLSPPKRTNTYAPQQTLSPQGADFTPPPRSHTQSPGALYGNRAGMKPADPVPRPSSVNDPTSPRSTGSVSAPFPTTSISSTVTVPPIRPRGFSQNLNLIPPTDGRERDPLQRWKGAPLISWGVGGTMVTSFPKDVPRYGINQVLPMIVRSPGEVKIKTAKDVYPLEERLAKFPGPLKGKSKKKETVAWLTTGIEALESRLPSMAFHGQPSLDEIRAVERVLLWKMLRLFIEYDGVLEGSPAIEKAARDILSPGVVGQQEPRPLDYALGSGALGFQGSMATQMRSEPVDSGAVEQIHSSLLVGDREKAVWCAADKRLWGHALLIANTVSPDLYKKVSQEFVRKEVNYPGHNNEPLAVLYEVLSGNHDECVDELVPVHARAGLQLMATDASHGQSIDSLAGLDKWRETLVLVLSNRSIGDIRALNSLGNLLSGYGRAEAAHICYFFARTATVFGGLDDPQSNFVLVGADHKRQADQFAKETEALLLSEVYEYGLSLAGGSKEVNCPHLAAYKLQHAMILAEHGYRDKALQYCETLAYAITSQTRRSLYHHAGLEAAVDNLAKRLRQAPKEESNSWIPKPSMNKVSDSVWNRFNKFVAGDEGDGEANGSADAPGQVGIFSRVPGGTPTISRPPSASGATGMEMFGGAVVHGGHHSYPATQPGAPVAPPVPATRATSRYAPASMQSAAAAATSSSLYEPSHGYPSAGGPSSTGRSSGEYSRGSYSPELNRHSSDLQPLFAYNPSHMPNIPSPALSHSDSGLGISNEGTYATKSPMANALSSPPPTDSPVIGSQGGYQAYGYGAPEPPLNGLPYAPNYSAPGGQKAAEAQAEAQAKADGTPSSGYQPPSYGYAPTTFTPFEPAPTEKSEATDQTTTSGGDNSSGGYEPPSFQPYGYEPPSYQPEPGASSDSSPVDDDGRPGQKTESRHQSLSNSPGADASTGAQGEKTKEEKDRENAELFRKAAEEDAKRAEAEKAAKAKKGWFGGGWFGGAGSKNQKEMPSEQPKAIRAKLGEENSFVFDPELKRWVNKKAGGADSGAAKTATPPPPRSAPRSASATPPPPSSMVGGTPRPAFGGPPPGRLSSAPPPRGPGALTATASVPNLAAAAAAAMAAAPPSQSSPSLAMPPVMQRSVSNTSNASGPPSRPATSMSNASSIDDLLSAAGPRKPGAKKARKSGRYVDVMAK